jgi:tetratricopeptide (TPR) repeat protein
MSEATLAAAAAHYQAGRLAEAERECEALLLLDPENAGALNLLGILAGSSDRAERAVELLGRAIARDALHIRPIHANLAAALRRLRRNEEALASCDAALALQPDSCIRIEQPRHRAAGARPRGRGAGFLRACDRRQTGLRGKPTRPAA